MNDVADVLRKALDVLRERGLAKEQLGDRQGRVCRDGALNVAMTGDHDVYPQSAIFSQADALLSEVEEANWGEVGPAFNDHPDTTQDDVERAFEKAIARAEEMV